jgi:alkanesulfonate monooxygenase SsuD/methylene tetrahydromethanopterin reductase-like flavin-dependent oxidoreductase (luciferase family)
MSWGLTRPFSEVQKYKQQFEEALARAPGVERPRFATMRHTAVYERSDEWPMYVEAVRKVSAVFENLFRELGEVKAGFAQPIPFEQMSNKGEYEPEGLRDNLIFGTPEEVVAKLKRYEALGVDNFFFRGSFGLPHDVQKRSLSMFIDEVMPAFRNSRHIAEAAE